MMMRSPLELDRRSLLGGMLGLLALGTAPALAGCSRSSSGAGPVAPVELTPLAYHAAREDVGLADAPHLAAVVTGMREFAQQLHRVSATAQQNWTASPVSIAMAFGMLRAGARGGTARQLDDVFGWPGGPAAGSPHEALNAITADLVTTEAVPTGPAPTGSDGTAPPPIVAVANGLFVDRSFAPEVREEFLALLATQYGAQATAVSFADPVAAAAVINGWVDEHTRGRIDKLFDELDPTTVLVLANAVYLKTTWASQFGAASTTDGPFRTTDGSVTAPLMHQQLTDAAYDDSAHWQRIVLPYVGGELTMRVVVPRAVVRDAAALNALLPLAVAKPASRHELVDLTLPRWDTATDLPLLAPLADLGFTDLGELTGIAPGVEVSDAIHRANVTVDEEGTEAAAVTGIAVRTSAVIATPVELTADRPFIWAVVHEPAGTPVFAGHVVDPTR